MIEQGSETFLTTHIHTYTDVYTALCNEEKSCISLCNSDLNDENSDKCLMYESEAFKKMPNYPMLHNNLECVDIRWRSTLPVCHTLQGPVFLYDC